MIRRWLDTVPTSRVITRCTQDIRAVDGTLPTGLADIIDLIGFMLFRLLGVVFVAPIFFLPGLLVGVVGAMCGQLYIMSQLSVKREMSNARAPVLGHFGAAINGLSETQTSRDTSFSLLSSIFESIWCSRDVSE